MKTVALLTGINDPAVVSALKSVNVAIQQLDDDLQSVRKAVSALAVDRPQPKQRESLTTQNRVTDTYLSQDKIHAMIVDSINSRNTTSVIRKFLENVGSEPPIYLNAPHVFIAKGSNGAVFIGAGGIGGAYNDVPTFAITSVDGSFFFGRQDTPQKQITFDAQTGALTFGSDIRINTSQPVSLQQLYDLASTNSGYSLQQLKLDLAAGVNNIIATSTTSTAKLTITDSYIAAIDSNAVYNGYSAWADNNNTRTCALALGAGGIFMGYNDVDGNWVTSISIDASTGTASFTGSINATSGNFTGLVTAGAIISSNAKLSSTLAPISSLGQTADWAYITAKPANIAALNGTEAIKNSLITITDSGVLQNAGGGQVTLSGLGYTGAPNATRNVVTYSSSTPSSPQEGDLWCDTSVVPNLWKLYVGGTWRTAGSLITSSVNPASYIAANSITADRLNVSSLSAISANLGTVTAGTIGAGVVYSGYISASQISAGTISAAVNIDSGGYIRAYGNYGTPFSIPVNGGNIPVYTAMLAERNATSTSASAIVGRGTSNGSTWTFGVVGIGDHLNYGVGVYGRGYAGIYGNASSAAGYGVYAENTFGGRALQVSGDSGFIGNIYAASSAAYLNSIRLTLGNSDSSVSAVEGMLYYNSTTKTLRLYTTSWQNVSGGGSMVYPPSGVAVSTGSSWGSSLSYSNSNVGSSLVFRDASGNFSANIITATLNGNASSATNATTASSAYSATNSSQLGGYDASYYPRYTSTSSNSAVPGCNYWVNVVWGGLTMRVPVAYP